jgi:hypothetical protein
MRREIPSAGSPRRSDRGERSSLEGSVLRQDPRKSLPTASLLPWGWRKRVSKGR